MDHFCYLVLCLSCVCICSFATLWSSVGNGLTSWLLYVMSNCDFVPFPCGGILGQVWYLIVLIPDLCHLFYFNKEENSRVTQLHV